MLLRLRTTARLMQAVAHPDDEDGGMLTLESRGNGVTTLLLTLNRGEGGQNKMGSNLFDVLGILRTLELTGGGPVLRGGATLHTGCGFRFFQECRRNISEMARSRYRTG